MLHSIIRFAAEGIGVAMLFLWVPAVAADDLSAARDLAVSHCSTCHTFGKGEPHGQGPNLFGVVGREAGTAYGFNFSAGFRQALKGKTWDPALLERFLSDTLAVAPEAGMVYWQDDPAKRAALIRFLGSLR